MNSAHTDPIEPELAGARRADPASGTEPAHPGAALQAAMRGLALPKRSLGLPRSMAPTRQLEPRANG